jgi:hypothetical protein
MNSYLLAASAASFITFAIHTWLGGPPTVGPLLASKDMHAVPKYTNYYCWHLVTITLFVMGLQYGWAATQSGGMDVGWFAFILSGCFMIWNLILVAWKKQSFLYMPQWALFLVISALALPGLLFA